MNTINAAEKKETSPSKKRKIAHILIQILVYTGIAIGGIILLVALYQIIKYLFVAALLFIAWLCPRRWRW